MIVSTFGRFWSGARLRRIRNSSKRCVAPIQSRFAIFQYLNVLGRKYCRQRGGTVAFQLAILGMAMSDTERRDMIERVEEARAKLIAQIAENQKTIERSRELLAQIDRALGQLRKQ